METFRIVPEDAHNALVAAAYRKRGYDDAEAAAAAEADFDRKFKDHEAPEDVAEFQLGALGLQQAEDGTLHLPAVLAAVGFAASNGEARRLIDGGGVKLDGEAVAKGAYNLPAATLQGAVSQVGRRKWAKLL